MSGIKIREAVKNHRKDDVWSRIRARSDSLEERERGSRITFRAKTVMHHQKNGEHNPLTYINEQKIEKGGLYIPIRFFFSYWDTVLGQLALIWAS